MSNAFRALLLEGMRKFAEEGYTSEGDLQEWLLRLHAALEAELPNDEESRKLLAGTLSTVFGRDLRSGIAKRVPGVSRYTIDRVAPYLRAELDRRIFAGADLIRLNKKAAVEKTLQRFAGWTSSAPRGGTSETNLRAAASEILKPTAELKFQRRRVAIDQGHKLSAAVAHVVSQGEGAIAGTWHDRGETDHGYDARPEHLKRSGSILLIRDSWAMEQGLIRRTAAPFTDSVEQPAELPYCSCWYEYITSPRRLPETFLTARGRAWVADGGSIRNDSAEPTSAQLHAGNYPKGHIRVHGLDISIETPIGATRRGCGPDGKPWEVVMPADYGYIRRTIGADGEQIDCYVGPHWETPKVWIVDQIDAETRTFDEQKVLIGFPSRAIALEVYENGFSDGRGRLRIGKIHELSIEEFQRQVRADLTLLSA